MSTFEYKRRGCYDWPVTLVDGESVRVISRCRLNQLLNPDSQIQSKNKWLHSELGRKKRSIIQRRYYVKRWKYNAGKPLKEKNDEVNI